MFHGLLSFAFFALLLGVALIFGFILLAVRIFKGSSRPPQDEEARMIQEMYQKLGRMEERVESLETILMETEEKEPKP